ncbi:MAG: hypothetical protein DWQ04_13540 [Chloroflexi bacterium]|nr:MAG: hypothetical protein DWQ04_13540 [Chloroflexota bacterium]
MAHQLTLSLLGTFDAQLNGQPIHRFEYDKVRALLAYLAVEADRPHRRDVITGLFWPEHADAVARKSLNQALYTLRKALGDSKQSETLFILADRTAVQLNPNADVWLDVREFEAGVAAVANQRDDGNVETAVLPQLQTTVALYQGDFLKGLSINDSSDFEDWLVVTRERLHRQTIKLLDRLTQIETHRGEWQQALHYARRQVELEPWREEAHRQMMLLLARTGDTNAAIAQYETCKEVLTTELGMEPMQEATRLYQRIVAVRNGEYPHNLPHQQTELIGREDELQQLKQLLAHPYKRLITLVGPGGIGKTQLAIASAHQNRHRFLEGVTFVPLAALSEPEQMITSIASSLNFPLRADARRSPAQQLLDYFRRKEMLLVLDNFEHLLKGADFLARILSTAPNMQLLVTSRERLQLQSEQLFPVSGLEYPNLADERAFNSGTPESNHSDLTYAAGQLFMIVAQRQQPGFSLKTADEVQKLATLSNLVVGMPLALELAASWVDMLSLPNILDEVQKSLNFLESERRDVPERHRSIRAMFDTSWQLLSEQEQAIFAQLSVFKGGFTREAAKAVTGASLRQLSRFNRKSLVQYVEENGRYQIHELLRQYGAEQLGQDVEEETAVRNRHATFYCTLLQKKEAELKGPKQVTALVEIEADQTNIRTAWRWAVTQGQVSLLNQAMEGIGIGFKRLNLNQEGETLFQLCADKLVIDVSLESQRAWLRAQSWLTRFVIFHEKDIAIEKSRQILSKLSESPFTRLIKGKEKAFILLQLSTNFYFVDWQLSQTLLEQGLALYKAADDLWGIAGCLSSLSNVAFFLENIDESIKLEQESLKLSRKIDNKHRISISLSNLTETLMIFQKKSNPIEVKSLIKESMEISQEIKSPTAISLSQIRLAQFFYHISGQFEQAYAQFLEILGMLLEKLENLDGITSCLRYIGETCLHLGKIQEAIERSESALHLARKNNYLFVNGYLYRILGYAAIFQKQFAKAEMHLEKAIAEMLSSGLKKREADTRSIACIALLHLDKQGLYCQQLISAIEFYLNSPAIGNTMYLEAGMIHYFLSQGEHEKAIELWTLSSLHPVVSNSQWFAHVVGQPVAKAAAKLLPDIVTMADGS